MSTVYAMLVITGMGLTSQTAWPTKAACEDAASVALTGSTVEGAEELRREAAAERKGWMAKWAEAHPPREARTMEEKAALTQQTLAWGAFMGNSWHRTAAGLIQEDPPSDMPNTTREGEWIATGAEGRPVVKTRDSVRSATCFAVEGAGP